MNEGRKRVLSFLAEYPNAVSNGQQEDLLLSLTEEHLEVIEELVKLAILGRDSE